MKKILKNKIVLMFAAALVAGFGGTVLYLSKTVPSTKNDNQKNNVSTQNNQKNTNPQTEKGNLPAANQTPPPKTSVQEQAPNSTSTNLAVLNGFVTATKSSQDGSISFSFYLEGSGYYSIQEEQSGSWQTTENNIYYRGTGGLDAGSIPAGQSSVTVRALKIENGKYTAVTKAFTIQRSEVEAAGGVKTYN